MVDKGLLRFQLDNLYFIKKNNWYNLTVFYISYNFKIFTKYELF